MIGHWIDMEMALNFLFHVLVGYLYVFFGKTSIQINSLFLNPVITLAFLLLFLRYLFVGVSYIFWDFPDGSAGKMSASSARDTGSACPIPGWGRSPGGGNGNPHQYSCLENSMDRGAWGHRVGHNWASNTIQWNGASKVTLMIKNPPTNAGDIRDTGSIPWVGKIPWRRTWQPLQ